MRDRPRAVLALICCALLLGAGAKPTAHHGAMATITLPDGAVMGVDVANTPALRAHGLMFREGLPPDAGLLFVYPEAGTHPFWMQHMQFGLDILSLDAEGRVLRIAADVPPPRAGASDDEIPRVVAEGVYVLELPAGTAAQHYLAVGDTLRITFPP